MKTIVCFGDSNTYGLMPEAGGRYSRRERWPGILQSLLGDDCYVVEEGLNGRTTVWDDPVGEECKNGLRYLLPCLGSHKPMDLVILMLGINDCKTKFAVSAYDIGRSMEVLIKTVLRAECGPQGGAPEILVVPPVPLGRTDVRKTHEMMGSEGFTKSKGIAGYYREFAQKHGANYLDPAGAVETGGDGIHFTAAGHAAMAGLVEAKIREIL